MSSFATNLVDGHLHLQSTSKIRTRSDFGQRRFKIWFNTKSAEIQTDCLDFRQKKRLKSKQLIVRTFGFRTDH